MRPLADIATEIQAQEFEHCFTLHADGTITDAPNVWAPDVYLDPTGDVDIQGTGWSAITGLTGQYGYHGAVMHQSEFIGSGVARVMLEMVEDAPLIFATVIVYDLEDETDDNIVGWAITYREVGP